jgi:hypothetical protein
LELAIAAVSAAATSAATATSAAVSAATASPTTAITAATAMSAAASAASATFALRASFVDHQCATQELFAVQRSDYLFRFGIVANLGEAKAARLTCKSIAQQRQRIWLHTYFRKQRLQLLFSGLKRKVAHIQFLHGRSPCAFRGEGTPAGLKRQDRSREKPEVH